MCTLAARARGWRLYLVGKIQLSVTRRLQEAVVQLRGRRNQDQLFPACRLVFRQRYAVITSDHCLAHSDESCASTCIGPFNFRHTSSMVHISAVNVCVRIGILKLIKTIKNHFCDIIHCLKSWAATHRSTLLLMLLRAQRASWQFVRARETEPTVASRV